MSSFGSIIGGTFKEMAGMRSKKIEAQGRITDNVHLKIRFSDFLLFTCEGRITSAEIMAKTPIGVYAPPKPPELTAEERDIASIAQEMAKGGGVGYPTSLFGGGGN